MINLTVLDDLGLVSTRKPMGSWVKPATGMGMGTAKNTRGLPVQFTRHIFLLHCDNPSLQSFLCWNYAAIT